MSTPVRLIDQKRSEMKGRGFAGRRPLRVLLAGIVTFGFLGVTLTSYPSIATSSFDPMQCAPSDRIDSPFRTPPEAPPFGAHSYVRHQGRRRGQLS